MLPFRATAGKWQLNIPSDTETALSLTHGSAQLGLPSGGAFSVKKDDGKYTLKTSADSTLSITITEDDVELYKEKTFLAKVGDIDESQLYELLARQFPVSVDSGQNPEEEGDPSGGRRRRRTRKTRRQSPRRSRSTYTLKV